MNEITVIGGGIVGLATALALAKSNFSVTLVMGDQPESVASDYISPQVCAINQTSQRLLRRLGVWDDCQANPFSLMALSAQPNAQRFSFDASTVGQDNLGYIVSNDRLRWLLFRQVQHAPNLTVIMHAKAQALSKRDRSWVIETDRGDRVYSHVVIGADGRQSWVAKQRHWKKESIDYQQTAWVSLVTSQYGSPDAFQYFSASGPVGLLPLGREKYWAMIMSLDNHIQQDNQDIDRLLKQYFGKQLGRLVSQDLVCFPLKGHHVDYYGQDGLFLVGDALHTIHQLAGQGMNLGLLDVAALVDVFTTVTDWQSSQAVTQYHYWRKGHNDLMYRSVHRLMTYFQSVNPLVSLTRSIGLLGFDRCQQLKSLAINVAMGYTGRQPSWVK
ncbi:MAG: hypothetical protein CMF46_05230 [Legionellales bacterium]|nr:hypothetical protein [Legionellales bacterium]